MTIVAPRSRQFDDSPAFLPHVPGVRGGLIGTAGKFIGRYGYRGAQRLGRYLFRPKKPTLSGAVRRGTGLGIVASQFINDEFEDEVTDGPIQTTTRFNPNRFKQRNRRRRCTPRPRCDHYRY